MKITVAGRDRTEDLGPALRQQAAAMARLEPRCKPAMLAPDISALALQRAQSEAEYLDQLIRLIRYRDAVDTLDFDIPRKPGVAGLLMVRLKAFLWKLLRYQHDRIMFRQNLINAQLTSALAFEIAERQKEIVALKQRVAELEKRVVNNQNGKGIGVQNNIPSPLGEPRSGSG